MVANPVIHDYAKWLDGSYLAVELLSDPVGQIVIKLGHRFVTPQCGNHDRQRSRKDLLVSPLARIPGRKCELFVWRIKIRFDVVSVSARINAVPTVIG
jgi:hypothetical protein